MGTSAAGLPTGTVTFLFTDVAGSTALWEADPELARTAMLRHDDLTMEAVTTSGGVLVRPRGEGDSHFAVFDQASDAVAAALKIAETQRAEPWATARPLEVRMALHTGVADL